MAFKSYENDGGLMAEGDYEVICLKCMETTTKTSKLPVIAFDFQVRSDVEQKYQKKHIFKNFYKDDQTGDWPYEKIGKYANALGIPKGEEFDLPDLVGKCCILHMKPFTGNDGIDRDCIFYCAKSKVGQMVQNLETEASASGFEEVADEELPF